MLLVEPRSHERHRATAEKCLFVVLQLLAGEQRRRPDPIRDIGLDCEVDLQAAALVETAIEREMFGVVAEQTHEYVIEGRRAAFIVEPAEGLLEARDPRCLQKRPFVGEVLVEGHPGHTCGGCEIRDADLVDLALLDEHDRRLNQRIASSGDSGIRS